MLVPTLRQGTLGAEHLDRVAWATGFSVDAHGMLIGLRASHRSAHAALQRVVPPGVRIRDVPAVEHLYSLIVADGSRRVHRLYEDAECTARSMDLDELLRAFQSQLHFRVAVGARTRLFVHAGVVGWREGAILVPGRSHSGKSSLVAALVRAGATYYSDEYAVLDDEGLVHPFPRPLGIRDAQGRTNQVSASAFGAETGEAPLPVTSVVVTRHVPGARWLPRRMSPGETVLALLENTVAVRSRPADALRILTKAAASTSAVRGDRGEASEIVEQILTSTTRSVH